MGCELRGVGCGLSAEGCGLWTGGLVGCELVAGDIEPESVA